MPGRKAKPPRLWFRDDDGVWVILDRGRQIRTGCTREQVDQAAIALTEYIGQKHKPTIGVRDPDRLAISDVLAAYEEAKRPQGYDPELPRGGLSEACHRHDDLCGRIDNLNTFLGLQFVSAIKSELCRDYADWRTHTENKRNRERNIKPPQNPVSPASARRELEDLRAAVNAYHADHVLTAVPTITLPAKSLPRDRWLTRTEGARLLAAALGFTWDKNTGTWKRDESGRLVRRDRVTRTRRRHAARFILIGLYSARREATIRRTQWFANTTGPWFDLSTWVYHGRGAGERMTKKRRPPARVANRLRPHLGRWHRLDQEFGKKLGKTITHVVHWHNGEPLSGKIKTGWNGILTDAGLGPDVVRHILRHTAATWVMQSGPKDLWAAAGWLGMTVEMLEEVYGHHHPDFQSETAEAFGRRR